MSYPALLVTPPVPPAPPVRPLRGLTVTWEAPDGRVWDLNDVAGGVILDMRNVEGLHFPLIDRWTRGSSAIPGHRLRGWRTRARSVFWPIFIQADDSSSWLELQEAFFHGIHPDQAGTWRVSAGGQTRSLRLTGVFDDVHAYGSDPLHRAWEQYGVKMEAAQPYWVGKTIEAGPWSAPSTEPFFPGPTFTISDGAGFTAAAISNPGDVTAYPRWIIDGELDDISVGVGSAVITLPFPVNEGERVVIDTDPRNPSAFRGPIPATDDEGREIEPFVGEDVTAELGVQAYASVPPGGSVPLSLAATGTGTITCQLDPLYFRAFGGRP